MMDFTLKKIKKETKKILSIDVSGLTDDELRVKMDIFREEKSERNLHEAFAIIREASKRILGMEHFPVQIMGGLVLYKGNVAEMKTGEGKTLVTTCPAIFASIMGNKVHVVTVNDYLAERDMQTMKPLYEFFGVSVGCVLSSMGKKQRRNAYEKDITYGTNKEFGFDYLRDNMVQSKEEEVQTSLDFVIIDEVDSILIDEARTPMIISERKEDNEAYYRLAEEAASILEKGTTREKTKMDYMISGMTEEEIEEMKDYVPNQKTQTIQISDRGIEKIERMFGEKVSDNEEILFFVTNALRAKEFMKKDKNYIVSDGKVIIVDDFTGRIMDGRRFSDGLHQAIEAKEKVEILGESKTIASITIQNYFKLYKRMSGMSGTVKGEEPEFLKVYDMEVVQIPTNNPVQRVDEKDIVYYTKKAKEKRIIEEVKMAHKKGQPVLIGTSSIESSERLSFLLKKEEIKHNVLNAKKDKVESYIIAQAGRYGAVTIATNMAGRGTDILLGGNPDSMAKETILSMKYTEEDIRKNPDVEKEYLKLKEIYKSNVRNEKKAVIESGGLFVIGTEKNEAKRIDDQLRGRSGRQGDVGKSIFIVSLEDDMMKNFAPASMQEIVKENENNEEEVTSKFLLVSVKNIQKKIEGRNYETRKSVLEFDDVDNEQRKVIYKRRKEILEKESEDYFHFIANSFAKESFKEIDVKEKMEEFGIKNSPADNANDFYHDIACQYAKIRLDAKKEYLDIDGFEKNVMLDTFDHLWMDYLVAMNNLRSSVSLMGFSDKPIEIYKRESFHLFNTLIQSIKEEIIKAVLTFDLHPKESFQSDDGFLFPAEFFNQEGIIGSGVFLE